MSSVANHRDESQEISWHFDESLETSIAINQAYQELLDNLNQRVSRALQHVRQRQVSSVYFLKLKDCTLTLFIYRIWSNAIVKQMNYVQVRR
jgi:hypothetical protein